MELYKYCGESGQKILRHLEIKATPPNEFNDPFEFSPKLYVKDPHAHAEKRAREIITDRKYFEANRASLLKFRGFEHFQRVNRANLKSFIEALEADYIACQSEFEIFKETSKEFGIISFSEDPIQPLMWAHYADAHKGLVIEFDIEAKIFAPNSLFPVSYGTDRVQVEMTEPLDNKTVQSLATHKSEIWAYEKELRLIVALEQTRRDFIDNKNLYFLKFEPKVLKSVTFGLRASKELQADVCAILSQPHLAHVNRLQITADPKEFRLHRQTMPGFPLHAEALTAAWTAPRYSINSAGK